MAGKGRSMAGKGRSMAGKGRSMAGKGYEVPEVHFPGGKGAGIIE